MYIYFNFCSLYTFQYLSNHFSDLFTQCDALVLQSSLREIIVLFCYRRIFFFRFIIFNLHITIVYHQSRSQSCLVSLSNMTKILRNLCIRSFEQQSKYIQSTFYSQNTVLVLMCACFSKKTSTDYSVNLYLVHHCLAFSKLF